MRHGEERRQGLPVAALASAAIGAAVVYQLMLLIPLALMFALPVLWYRSVFLLWAAGLGFLVLAWVVQPSAHDDLQDVDRAKAPQLYEWLDALCARLGAPRIHRIALTNELNAGALEVRRGVSIRPTRRVLVLGVPLLALLDRAGVEAVVAHELGHFSREHGRLGHWLYRTRAAWERHVQEVADGESSPWERAGASFAAVFVPWFSRHSFAHMRRCEFEADRLACAAVGAPVMARALAAIALASQRWREQFEREVRALQLAHEAPPPRWLDTVLAALRDKPCDADERTRLLDEYDDEEHTHPPLTRRLAALGVAPQAADLFLPLAVDAAGPELLGSAWADALRAAEASAVDPRLWAMRHAALQALAARRRDLRMSDTSSRERVRIEWAFREPAPTLTAAQPLLDGDAIDPVAAYCAGCALEMSGRGREAIEQWQRCIDRSPVFAAPARARMAAALDALHAPRAERTRNAALRAKALDRRKQAVSRVSESFESADAACEAAALDDTQRQAIVGALRAQVAIREAWCLGMRAALDERRDYAACLFVLRVDPASMRDQGIEEDELADQLRRVVSDVVDPEVLLLVHTLFTTEPVPPSIERRLAATALARLR